MYRLGTGRRSDGHVDPLGDAWTSAARLYGAPLWGARRSHG